MSNGRVIDVMEEPAAPVVVAASQSVSEMDRQKLERDIARAEAREKRLLVELQDRSFAPLGISVGQVWSDPRQDLIERLVPEALPDREIRPGKRKVYKEGATQSVWFDSSDKHKRNVEKGWIPVQDSDGLQACDSEGDLMYRRDIAFTRASLEQSGKLSRSYMERQDDDMSQADKASGGAVSAEKTETEITQKKR